MMPQLLVEACNVQRWEVGPQQVHIKRSAQRKKKEGLAVTNAYPTSLEKRSSQQWVFAMALNPAVLASS